MTSDLARRDRDPRTDDPTLPQLPALPALVTGHVTHHRSGSVRHAFRHSVYQWLVDLDALPEQPWYLEGVRELQRS